MRENTERSETIEMGANVLAEANSWEMLKGTKQMLMQGNGWQNPFGDGTTGQRIVQILGYQRKANRLESYLSCDNMRLTGFNHEEHKERTKAI